MKKRETCNNCGNDYTPSRKGVQKFCSNSCRSRYWFLKQKDKKVTEKDIAPISEDNILPKTKQEQISFAGVGNATAGTLIADGLKSVLTKSENKPATKKDIQELKDLIFQRYLPVNNMENDAIGRRAFYDIQTKHIVYILQK